MLFFSLEPARRLASLMGRVLVYNQDDLSANLSFQPLKKSDKHPRIESLFEDHEIKPPPVGNRGNHIASEALARAMNHGRVTPPTPGAARLVGGSQPHLIAPMDLS